jgi:hypothetical protein
MNETDWKKQRRIQIRGKSLYGKVQDGDVIELEGVVINRILLTDKAYNITTSAWVGKSK